LQTANSKDCKNLIVKHSLHWVSSYWCSKDKQVLSSGDVTGCVKNTLFLCMRFTPFNTSISRSHYRTHVQSGNLLSAKIKQLFVLARYATTHIVRSVMWLTNKWSARYSFRYLIPAACSAKIRVSPLPLLYASAVTLHSTRIIFMFIMLIDTCHLRGRGIRRESQQQSNATVYFVGASNLIML